MENLKPIFSAIQKFTTIDDNDFLGATFFTGGCNFRCHYCHNPQFVLSNEIKYLSVSEVKDFLNKRKGIIESIIICGGEPTIHSNLLKWIKYIKGLGYRIKLDTNATNPIMIKKIIDDNLVDFFAIDYKAPIGKYKDITQREIDKFKIIESIKLIVNSNIDYEFRSTIHSSLHSKEDITKMINELKNLGVKNYYLQNYIEPKKTVGSINDTFETKDLVLDFIEDLNKSFEESGVRNT